jgi:hypothetical protein
LAMALELMTLPFQFPRWTDPSEPGVACTIADADFMRHTQQCC